MTILRGMCCVLSVQHNVAMICLIYSYTLMYLFHDLQTLSIRKVFRNSQLYRPIESQLSHVVFSEAE